MQYGSYFVDYEDMVILILTSKVSIVLFVERFDMNPDRVPDPWHFDRIQIRGSIHPPDYGSGSGTGYFPVTINH
jgi:hypothetical protein